MEGVTKLAFGESVKGATTFLVAAACSLLLAAFLPWKTDYLEYRRLDPYQQLSFPISLVSQGKSLSSIATFPVRIVEFELVNRTGRVLKGGSIGLEIGAESAASKFLGAEIQSSTGVTAIPFDADSRRMALLFEQLPPNDVGSGARLMRAYFSGEVPRSVAPIMRGGEIGLLLYKSEKLEHFVNWGAMSIIGAFAVASVFVFARWIRHRGRQRRDLWFSQKLKSERVIDSQKFHNFAASFDSYDAYDKATAVADTIKVFDKFQQEKYLLSPNEQGH